MKVIENVNEYYRIGLDDKDIEDLNRIINKIKDPHSGIFIKDFTEEQHIDLQCEVAQYEEESLSLFASHVLR